MNDESCGEIKICRICITNSSQTVMVSIFNESELWKQIKSFADVEILEGDHLPQQVCSNCANSISSISVFKKRTEEADAFFRLELLKGLDYHYKHKGDLGNLSNFEQPSEVHEIDDETSSSSSSEEDDDDSDDDEEEDDDDNSEEDLPLIPEIELVTPNEDNGQHEEEDDDEEEEDEPRVPFTENHVEGHVVSYECSTCKKTYLNRRFMEKHVRRGRCIKKRKNQTRPMECFDCHVVFPSGHHYGWHKRNGCPSSKDPNSSITMMNQQQNHHLQQTPSFFNSMTQNPTNPFKKRTGRNRIKLDAAMLNRAKTLILQRATTSQLADQLKISRTFAWRLRKNMLNDCMNSSENGLSDQDVIPLPQQPGCSNDSEEKLMVRKLIKREKDKIRKPNVFINEEMYDRAKEFVNLNMSTLEIARHLNISQMTAWKLRDAITKGIKLTFRQKTSPVPKNTQSQSNARREKLLSKKQKKAQERLERDKQITQEILKIVQEDYSIQYWKISEKLSQKGYIMSTSSVCQKLKALGIQRRFKCREKQRQQEEENGEGDGVNYNNNLISQLNQSNNENAEISVLDGGHFMSLGL